jgi:hypothetical protein
MEKFPTLNATSLLRQLPDVVLSHSKWYNAFIVLAVSSTAFTCGCVLVAPTTQWLNIDLEHLRLCMNKRLFITINFWYSVFSTVLFVFLTIYCVITTTEICSVLQIVPSLKKCMCTSFDFNSGPLSGPDHIKLIDQCCLCTGQLSLAALWIASIIIVWRVALSSIAFL